MSPEMTPVFRRLSTMPTKITDEDFAELERFTVLLYDRTSSCRQINKARQMLFSKSTRSLENIPPSRDALQEHTKRAVFQAGYVWTQATVRRPEVPSPEDWCWERGDNGWTPTWTTLPEASKVCKELVRCGCRKSCSGLSRCFKASLPCTSLCYSAGNCHQQD
jgi:hypothetical protein